MKTLKELLEGVELPVKVQGGNYDPHEWIEIRYKHKSFYYGHDYSGYPESLPEGLSRWHIFTEPKPKVKRAQYLVYQKVGNPVITPDLYKDDIEFILLGHYDYKFFKRLEEIECEL